MNKKFHICDNVLHRGMAARFRGKLIA